jgi:hypothetical protein
MGLETMLGEALTTDEGRAAQACLRWLVTGNAPVGLRVDVAWPGELRG